MSLLMTIFLLGSIQNSFADDIATIVITKPSNYLLGICATDTQIDCLEPTILVSHADGTTSKAILIDSPSRTSVIETPNLSGGGFHRFKVASGAADGYLREFNVSVSLTTSPENPLTGLAVHVVGAGKKLQNSECEANLSKLCSRYNLDPEDTFRISVRLQEMPIQWLSAHAQNADILSEKLVSGNRWVLSGSQTLVGWNPGLWWSVVAFSTTKTSALTESIIQCSKFGVVFKSSNEVSGGMPSWNEKTNSLDFGVFGPHLDANGDLNKGFFKARIPKKWLDCVYPKNSLSTADVITVNIVYDDGAIQIATTRTRVNDEMIEIEVPILHFSSPTIRVANAAYVSQQTSKPAPKASSCVKGKNRKQISGNKCPAGWKLSS